MPFNDLGVRWIFKMIKSKLLNWPKLKDEAGRGRGARLPMRNYMQLGENKCIILIIYASYGYMFCLYGKGAA